MSAAAAVMGEPSLRKENQRRFSLFAPHTLSPIPEPMPDSRSRTPPPPIKKIQEDEDDDDEWVSISTEKMSPFMVLRIKALIELASIKEEVPENPVDLKVSESPVRLKPCLKVSTPPPRETAELERQRYEMDSGERCVTLLNDLLEIARASTAPVMSEVNEAYAQKNMDVKLLPPRHPKLSFCEGASLLCFDSSEKPRKVKENHNRHFAKFLAYQLGPQPRRNT
eukprot:Protomagalhaensia_wolfi_Nauph_80__2378@NODE_2563_length_1052_cov_768_588351_g2005_i0_p1_GENE_NODE_2563_length_1052_cov_768_588351_g2005_i0NODE_2563_length_1052_cov_768_588351_g2005_i0_p1_ORF_typecomplete_len224_score39_03CRF/PF00473_17/57CRF/PF00473_17/6_4_NODE_2563_length_1052_cov_768_588351_g2005_i03341005